MFTLQICLTWFLSTLINLIFQAFHLKLLFCFLISGNREFALIAQLKRKPSFEGSSAGLRCRFLRKPHLNLLKRDPTSQQLPFPLVSLLQIQKTSHCSEDLWCCCWWSTCSSATAPCAAALFAQGYGGTCRLLTVGLGGRPWLGKHAKWWVWDGNLEEEKKSLTWELVRCGLEKEGFSLHIPFRMVGLPGRYVGGFRGSLQQKWRTEIDWKELWANSSLFRSVAKRENLVQVYRR